MDTMQTAFIKTPLGIAKIEGDENGIASVSILDDELPVSDVIPEILEDCAYQLHEYFEGKRQNFNLDLNPEGTGSKKVFGMNCKKSPLAKPLPI